MPLLYIYLVSVSTPIVAFGQQSFWLLPNCTESILHDIIDYVKWLFRHVVFIQQRILALNYMRIKYF